MVRFNITVNPGNTLSDLNRLEQALKTGVKPALQVGGKAAEERAKQIVPVRTGALRASIYHKVTDNSLEIGATQNYSAAVEFGHRRYPFPRPYIRPGAETALTEIQKTLPKGLGLS